jgi:hypothetical protein
MLIVCTLGLPEEFFATGLSLRGFIGSKYEDGLKDETIVDKSVDRELYSNMWEFAKEVVETDFHPLSMDPDGSRLDWAVGSETGSIQASEASTDILSDKLDELS